MADKYKKLKKKAQKNRAKKRMCLDKKQYDNEQDAFQKGQIFYKCPHCKKYHRSGKINTLIVEVQKKTFKNVKT